MHECKNARVHSCISAFVHFPRLPRLSEQNLAKVVQEKERVGNSQAGEKADDVAVEQNRLPSARRGVRPVPQIHFVDNDVFRVARIARRRRAEKAEQGAVGSAHPRQTAGQPLSSPASEGTEEPAGQEPSGGPVPSWATIL